MRTLEFFFRGVNVVAEEKAKQGILWIPCWNLREEEEPLTASDIGVAIIFSILVSLSLIPSVLILMGGGLRACVVTVFFSTCLWLLFLSIDRIYRQKKIREKKW